MDPDSKRLRVSVSDGRGRAVRDGGLAQWLARVAPRARRGDVAIALVSDARMRALNRQYRGGRRSRTDVLSFPAESLSSAQGRSATSSSRPALPGARREAGHSYQAELRVLALHGLLHLLGYDHHDADDNGRMARLERTLRRKGGLEQA